MNFISASGELVGLVALGHAIDRGPIAAGARGTSPLRLVLTSKLQYLKKQTGKGGAKPADVAAEFHRIASIELGRSIELR
jgi:hypothetical protein